MFALPLLAPIMPKYITFNIMCLCMPLENIHVIISVVKHNYTYSATVALTSPQEIAIVTAARITAFFSSIDRVVKPLYCFMKSFEGVCVRRYAVDRCCCSLFYRSPTIRSKARIVTHARIGIALVKFPAKATYFTSVHSFIRSYVRSFVRPPIRSFVRPFVRPFAIRPFVRSSIRSVGRSFVRPFVHSFIHPFVRSFVVRSFVRSFVRLLSKRACARDLFRQRQCDFDETNSITRL